MRFTHFDHPIRRARLRAGLTLKRLGQQARIHFTKLSMIENGLEPRPDELARLAGVLGVPPTNLQLKRGRRHHAA